MSTDPIIFPEPQIARWRDGRITIPSAVAPVTPDPPDPLETAAVDLLRQVFTAAGSTITTAADDSAVRVLLGQPATAGLQAQLGQAAAGAGSDRSAEAYALRVAADEIALAGVSPAGTFYAAHTLSALLSQASTTGGLPVGEVVDWPDFRYRGLYIESKWGPDLMTLDDWRDLIDRMARLKFNSLGIGVYGCWVVQYDNQITEFLTIPFPDHPELETPKTLRWYSPAQGDWVQRHYRPPMFEEDFFGQVVAYGKSRNVNVRPHWNGPGHTTLIPRVFPEISARDADGRPVGYGYCFSNPRTYEVLFSLYDSVIDRHLEPHGGDWWHLAMDEVNPSAGKDPNDLSKVADPWCQCPECSQRSHADLLVDFAIRSCQHLERRGIRHITIWNDALEKLGAVETFAQRLRAAGVQAHVALQWWRYRGVLDPRPVEGVAAWTTPMAGYWSNLFHHNYLDNIYGMLRHAHDRGAEGADAYSIYDPAYQRNYACLAEYSWNQATTGDLYDFKRKFARATLPAATPATSSGGDDGGHQPDASEVFGHIDLLFDSSYGPLGGILDGLLYYWYTYPAMRHVRYPQDVIEGQLAERGRAARGLQTAATMATAIRDAMREADDGGRGSHVAADLARLRHEYVAESEKLLGVLAAYRHAIAGVRHYRRAESLLATDPASAAAALAEAATTLAKAQDSLAAAMAVLERTKAAYLLPHTLRDLSALYGPLAAWASQAKEARSAVASGSLSSLPTLT